MESIVYGMTSVLAHEHRLVMEAHLERRLATYEEVHRLVGNRSHNELLNLELVEKVDHATFHSVYKPRDVLGRFRAEEGDLDRNFLPPRTCFVSRGSLLDAIQRTLSPIVHPLPRSATES